MTLDVAIYTNLALFSSLPFGSLAHAKHQYFAGVKTGLVENLFYKYGKVN